MIYCIEGQALWLALFCLLMHRLQSDAVQWQCTRLCVEAFYPLRRLRAPLFSWACVCVTKLNYSILYKLAFAIKKCANLGVENTKSCEDSDHPSVF
jgi:hypothetical protein